jgi:ribosomal protein S18 acetylase RimI-like enzyme
MSFRCAYDLWTITPADEPFLQSVYASTRVEELALTNWTPEQKAHFCSHQFSAQTAHYRQHYPTAEYFVVEQGGVLKGRLYVDRWEKEIRIMDITLLPEYRRTGLGTQILRDLQAEAHGCGKSVSIHVERFNPARSLYERLGFQVKEDRDVYLLMEWRDESSGTAT